MNASKPATSHLLQLFGDFRTGEFRRALFLQMQFALIVFALLLGRTVRDALFLSRSGIKDLPLMYVGVGLVTTLATLFYSRLIARYSPVHVAPWLQFFFAVSFVAFAFAVQHGGDSVYSALYLWVEILTSITAIQFWNIANGQFDPRQAKRLYGFIAAGQAIGNLLCGLLASGAGKWVTVDQLLWVVAGGSLLAGAMYMPAVRQATDPQRQSAASKTTALNRENARDFGNYITIIIALVGITYIATSWVDFQFKVIAKRSLDEAELARFLGQFYGAVGVISFVIQLFLLRHITRFLGLFGAIALMPLLFLLFGSVLPVLPWLAIATGLKFSENGLRYAIYDPLMNTVFLPLPVTIRARVQSLVGGIVKPLAMGLAGLVLVPLSPDQPGGLAVEHLGTAIAVFSGVSLLLLMRMRRGYLAALVKQTAATIEARPQDPIVIQDQLSLERLLALVKQGGAQSVAWFLQRITVPDRQQWLKILQIACARSDLPMTLRARLAARFFEAGGDPQLLKDANDPTTSELLRLLAKPLRGDDWQKLAPYLEGGVLDVREASLNQLFASGVPEAVLHARDYLLIFAESGAVADRVLACNMAALLLPAEQEHLVGRSLAAQEYEVRAAALRFLSHTPIERFLPDVVNALEDRRLAGLAARALAKAGEQGLAALEFKQKKVQTGRSAWRRLGPAWATYAREAQLNWFELSKTITTVETDPIFWPPPLLASASAKQQPTNDPGALLTKMASAAENWIQIRRLLETLPDDQQQVILLRRAADERVDAAIHALMVMAFVWYRPAIENWERLLRSGLFANAKLRANLAEIIDQSLQTEQKQKIIDILEFQCQALAQPAIFGDCISPIPYLAAMQWPDAINLSEGEMTELVDRIVLINRLLFLSSVPLFNSLRGEDLEQIAELLEEIQYAPGTTFIHQGDVGDSLYLINKGRVRVHIGQQTLAELEAGAVVGEVALLDAQPRTASVTALDDVEVLRLSRADFEQLLSAYPQIARGIISVLTVRLRSLADQVKSIDRAAAQVATPAANR